MRHTCTHTTTVHSHTHTHHPATPHTCTHTHTSARTDELLAAQVDEERRGRHGRHGANRQGQPPAHCAAIPMVWGGGVACERERTKRRGGGIRFGAVALRVSERGRRREGAGGAEGALGGKCLEGGVCVLPAQRSAPKAMAVRIGKRSTAGVKRCRRPAAGLLCERQRRAKNQAGARKGARTPQAERRAGRHAAQHAVPPVLLVASSLREVLRADMRACAC